jgi:cytoskeletal protein CcmA (bactofilin family)
MAVNASHVSVVSRAARVRGRVTGDGDLEIRGYVEGDIAVGGELTVEAEGLVAAAGPLHARRIVVRGAVKGDLAAEESIVVEAGGRVVGDLKAPRITLAEGALVRGFVQTGDEGASAAPKSRASAARPVSTVASRAAPAARAVATPRAQTRAVPKVEVAPPPPVEASPASRAPLRRPPPPVVPALKKMRGQIVKKKER